MIRVRFFAVVLGKVRNDSVYIYIYIYFFFLCVCLIIIPMILWIVGRIYGVYALIFQ